MLVGQWHPFSIKLPRTKYTINNCIHIEYTLDISYKYCDDITILHVVAMTLCQRIYDFLSWGFCSMTRVPSFKRFLWLPSLNHSCRTYLLLLESFFGKLIPYLLQNTTFFIEVFIIFHFSRETRFCWYFES